MTPTGIAVVLTSSKERGGVPSARDETTASASCQDLHVSVGSMHADALPILDQPGRVRHPGLAGGTGVAQRGASGVEAQWYSGGGYHRQVHPRPPPRLPPHREGRRRGELRRAS